MLFVFDVVGFLTESICLAVSLGNVLRVYQLHLLLKVDI